MNQSMSLSRKSYSVTNLAQEHSNKGRYLMDYSRKYQSPYDIVEKAREHVAKGKKNGTIQLEVSNRG